MLSRSSPAKSYHSCTCTDSAQINREFLCASYVSHYQIVILEISLTVGRTASGIVAWVDATDGRMCKSLNLRTNEELCFTTKDRSTMSDVAVSASMIAAIDPSGKCWIWTLCDENCISLRMPSARVEKTLVSKKTLALIFPPETAGNARINVITWTLSNRVTNSFFLELQAPVPGYKATKIMLDSDGESIVLFERIIDTNLATKEYIQSTRVDLMGNLLAKSVLHCSHMDDAWNLADASTQTQANHPETIWSALQYPVSASSGTSHGIKRIRYSFQSDLLSVDIHFIDLPHSSLKTGFHFWKDVAYFWHQPQAKPSLYVVDLQTSKCSVSHMATIFWPTTLSFLVGNILSRYEYQLSRLLGDEVFHIRVFNEGLIIWCFDKNLATAEHSVVFTHEQRMMPATRYSHDWVSMLFFL